MSQAARDLYPLVGKKKELESSIVQIKAVEVGQRKPVLMVAVGKLEGREELKSRARALKRLGVDILLGGVPAALSSPYSDRGLQEENLELLAELREESGLAVAVEVMEPQEIELASQYVDLIEIAAQNMQNYSLLKEVGQSKVPILLKRGMSATIKEWLLAAEYILEAGNERVILCERGVRGFQQSSERVLDISAIPTLKSLSHLPVIMEPNYNINSCELLIPLAKAGLVAGADGILVDFSSSFTLQNTVGTELSALELLENLINELNSIGNFLGREGADVLS